MKRTPLQRRSPLKGTPSPIQRGKATQALVHGVSMLAAKVELDRSGTWKGAVRAYRRTSREIVRKSTLAKRGARGKREAKGLRLFRAAVLHASFIPGRGFVCARCDGDFEGHEIDAHHRLPRARGGAHELSNGAALCRPCHSAVHDKTANDWREFLVTTKPQGGSR